MTNKTTSQQSSQTTSQSKQSESSQNSSTWQNLAERNDFAGQTYRTIRDYPKTSAAIATGVAAAAGAGAFLLNRKKKVGTAFGHASSNDKIVSEVEQINKKGVSDAKS
ncbi:hypothetical protein [Sphingomicrobium lutaoense]|uniref:Uncharacterized protein n=1 Tax=Sphingomicrobium lutaoense TaxID=515949 RepID=A0A839Z0V7_9SPHN|nr:hypothetical protein [Sphingomicrobium lutaoense]MBB3763687.1 hypothetical protein [Sphingomicrobium lutaoense]